MKLLEKIDSIDLSDQEKDRIDKCLLDSESLPLKVLTTKAPAIHDYDFWRRAQRTFRITGFRDGHPKAIEMVVSRALDAQKSHPGRAPHAGWPLIWPLYLRTVHQYLRDDLPTLHQLLREEEFQSGPGTLTEQILRSIVKCLPLHGATVDEVRELYDLWGFERSNYAEEILSTASVEPDAIRRMIDEGVSTMRREIASAITSTKLDVNRHIEQHTSQLALLKGLVEKAQKDINNTAVKVQGSGDATNTPGKSAEPTATNAQKRGSQVAQVSFKRRAHDPSAAALEALQSRIEGLGRQLKELRNRVDILEPGDKASLSVRPGTSVETTVLQTVNKWSQVFNEVGIPSCSIGASWILLEIVRRSRIILTDKPQLFVALMNALPAGEVRITVASPTWTSEADWKADLAYITDDVAVPRLLIIQDFDVALQEAYLVPALISWLTTVQPHCANRIVLVPSDNELAGVSPRVFELATFMTHTAPHIRDLTRLGEAISDSPPTLELPQAGTSIVAYMHSRLVRSEDELRQYATNYGVSLPPRLLESFVNVYEGLRASLGNRDAGNIAQQAILMPWIEHARGEAVARIFQEALKTVMNGN